jgi:HK97 family phage major capsid protein
MKLADLIAQMRGDITKKLEARNKLADELATLRDAETQDEAKIAEVRKAKDALDAEIDQLREREKDLADEQARDEAADRLVREVKPGAPAPAYDEVARTGQEPRTYTCEKDAAGTASFFRDAYLMSEKGNLDARSRIERHAREVQVEGEMTERAASTGSFAGLIVPQYLVDQAALVAKAGRPTANIVTKLQLPEQGTQFQIPRGTTGAATAVQASENSAVQSTDEVWANVTVNVATVGGQQDVSRQSIERGTPGIDSLIYMDLAGAYGVNVGTQVLSGSGSSGQVLGILNTSGVNQATAFTAAATPATFYTKLAGQLNAVETTRFMAPTAIVMHPRRWNWLVGQTDSSQRPLVVPNAGGPNNALAVSGEPIDTPSAASVGTIMGLPVITDANIPTSVGTGPEDQVIVLRAQDSLLWEDGDGMPRELRFEQTLGGQLTVKLVVYGYIGFTAGRYPTSVGIVGGNAGTAGYGLVAPTF